MQKMQLSAINRWMPAINREKVAINHMINRVQNGNMGTICPHVDFSY